MKHKIKFKARKENAMNKMKKIIACLAAMAIVVTGTAGITALASSADTYFTDFTISALTYTEVSSPRLKENDTSVYCYITSAGNSVKAQVFGCSAYSFDNNLTLNSKYESANHVNLDIGIEYQIYNTVYETGYKYAGLKLKSDNLFNSDVISGRWSPDSENTDNMKVATS